MNKGCLIAVGLVLLLMTAGLIYYFSSKSEGGLDGFQTTKPEVMDIIKKTVATGSIKPRQEVQIKPQVSGVIDQLFVEAGEMVKKGQKLARVKLIPNEVNINNAKSNVELARIRYRESQRELKRQKDVFDKKLDVESARASLADAEQEEKRQKQLFDDGIISEQAYNQFKLSLNLRKAEFDNSEIVARNSLRQFEADVDIRKQEMDAAINNLQLLQEGATRNSGQVSNVVTSTVTGMILEIPVEEGSSVIERNNFNEGTSIASVADMNSLIFEGQVDESDVGKLREGMPLELTVGAIEEQKFDANLEYISPKGIEEEGSVKFTIKAAIKPTEDIFLRAGYSANGDIILDRRNQVLSIKERDLIFAEKSDSTFVEVATGEDQFEKRLVKVGLSDGIQIEVVSGLDSTTQIKVLKGSTGG
ncbi:MAG: HlyD family efflux transporter periplasmic adaptor subunit [Bacteroidota bacterium]